MTEARTERNDGGWEEIGATQTLQGLVHHHCKNLASSETKGHQGHSNGQC